MVRNLSLILILMVIGISAWLVKAKVDSCNDQYTKMFQELERKANPSTDKPAPVPPRPTFLQCLTK